MAFQYDPNATNQALLKTGSSYSVPVAQTPAPAAPVAPVAQPVNAPSFTAPAPAPPVKQATDTEVPGAPKPEPKGDDKAWAKQAGDIASVVASSGDSKDDEQAKKMNKLGALVGTVLSFYTGNYMGAAQGVQSMSEMNKADDDG